MDAAANYHVERLDTAGWTVCAETDFSDQARARNKGQAIFEKLRQRTRVINRHSEIVWQSQDVIGVDINSDTTKQP